MFTRKYRMLLQDLAPGHHHGEIYKGNIIRVTSDFKKKTLSEGAYVSTVM